MDHELKERIELYILENYTQYSKPQLVNELIKSGLSRTDANEIYNNTIKRIIRPSEVMEETSNSKTYFILFFLLILFIFLIYLVFN